MVEALRSRIGIQDIGSQSRSNPAPNTQHPNCIYGRSKEQEALSRDQQTLLHAEGKVTGAACLGSGYDFKAEMAHSASSKISYDNVILSYWKGYVNKHRRVLRRAPGVDLDAVKNARTLPVRNANLYVHCCVSCTHKGPISVRWAMVMPL